MTINDRANFGSVIFPNPGNVYEINNHYNHVRVSYLRMQCCSHYVVVFTFLHRGNFTFETVSPEGQIFNLTQNFKGEIRERFQIRKGKILRMEKQEGEERRNEKNSSR
jgi:hypothetical protein